VRGPKRKRPETLTLPPDERRLEEIIGSLQSEMGVPQNPQEYRLTIKVAEERDSGNGRSQRSTESQGVGDGGDDKPKREKAPAAPRMGGSEEPGAQREKAPSSRRRRSRRRRRGGRGRGDGAASGGGPAS